MISEILILFLTAILIPPIGVIIITISWGIIFSIGNLLGLDDE